MRFLAQGAGSRPGNERRVVVTGLGVITPLGSDPFAVFARVYRGESAVQPIRRIDVSGLALRHAAEVSELDPSPLGLSERERKGLERVQLFALLAAEQAVRDAGLALPRNALRGQSEAQPASERHGVAIGSSNSDSGPISLALAELAAGRARQVSPHTLNRSRPCSSAALVSIRYGLRGPVFSQNGASATGAMNLISAFDSIRSGRTDVMIAGGTDCGVTQLELATFGQNQTGSRSGCCRPFDRQRDGVVLGEGAALVVLEEAHHAAARGARIYGEMLGYGLRSDAFDMAAIPAAAPGLILSIEEALEDARLTAADIGYVNAHATATRLNDVAEAAAIRATLGRNGPGPAVSGTKGQLGHMLAASGSMGFILTLLASRLNRVPPTGGLRDVDPACELNHVIGVGREQAVPCGLTLSAGMGGLNSAIVVRGEPS